MCPSLNILVADDNPDDIFLLEQAFRRAKVTSRLISVCDGVEAIAYLKGEDAYADRSVYPFPEVLLLDLNMPRVNGFEVLEWMERNHSRGRPMVYVLTASAREVDVDHAYALHANCFVVKPNRLDDLVAFVSALHQWHEFVVAPRPATMRAALAGSFESP